MVAVGRFSPTWITSVVAPTVAQDVGSGVPRSGSVTPGVDLVGVGRRQAERATGGLGGNDMGATLMSCGMAWSRRGRGESASRPLVGFGGLIDTTIKGLTILLSM